MVRYALISQLSSVTPRIHESSDLVFPNVNRVYIILLYPLFFLRRTRIVKFIIFVKEFAMPRPYSVPVRVYNVHTSPIRIIYIIIQARVHRPCRYSQTHVYIIICVKRVCACTYVHTKYTIYIYTWYTVTWVYTYHIYISFDQLIRSRYIYTDILQRAVEHTRHYNNMFMSSWLDRHNGFGAAHNSHTHARAPIRIIICYIHT